MKKAQGRNALHEQKFWFRNDIQNKENDGYSQMSVNEIINGKDGFPGLVPLIQTFLSSMDVDADTQCTLQQYLSFISKRAKGDVWTAARWLREFVLNHPAYKQDSRISEEINFDLLVRISKLPAEPCPKLHGSILASKTQDDVPDILTQ